MATTPPDPPAVPVADAERVAALIDREWPKRWMAPFLEALCKIPNFSAACRAAGISRETYRRNRESDEDFRNAVTEALAIAVDLIEQIAHRRATVGEPHVVTRTHRRRAPNEDGAMVVLEETTTTTEETQISNAILMRLLEAHRPEKFSRRSDVHHSGDVPSSGPTVVVVERIPTRERMLELVELARELEPGPPDVDGTARPSDPSSNGS